MKKFLLVLLNIIVLISVGTAVYHYYLVELDSSITVECDYDYDVELNSMILDCDVIDVDLISSNDYPLTLFLYDESDSIVLEEVLQVGSNEIILDSLNYNSLYLITVEGYNYIKEEYISTTFLDYGFSTARENINIPTWTYLEVSITDSEYRFEIEIIDLDECVTSVDIVLTNSSNIEVVNHNYTGIDNLEFSFITLDPDSIYYVDIMINYSINIFDQLNNITISKDFTTITTPTLPTASILHVINDNVNLTFNLLTNDNDAEFITYTIELIDFESNVLYSEVTSDYIIIIPTDEIESNFYISVTASYIFNDTNYYSIELDTYSVLNNAISNFFTIPGLNITDTSLPLTSYDDYDDYIFTFFNQGTAEFSIYCEAPVNCNELVENELYSVIPFLMTDFVHAYFDVDEISYSYTSTQLNITLQHEYTNQDILDLDQEINTILDTIITGSMTDYEKILAVHDYVIDNTVYDSSCLENIATCDTDHVAIGVIFDGNAVCEGYAHTIDIMLRSLGIPTFKLSSSTHQWNAVYYNDAWYHLDATWDDPVTNNGSNILLHNYFLITNAELVGLDTSDSHTFSTTYVYFIE